MIILTHVIKYPNGKPMHVELEHVNVFVAWYLLRVALYVAKNITTVMLLTHGSPPKNKREQQSMEVRGEESKSQAHGEDKVKLYQITRRDQDVTPLLDKQSQRSFCVNASFPIMGSALLELKST
ncbi:hypothetical protein Tco_1312409 [Tanacetum coccineum]